jgi:Protein of unknown function (DUF3761)
MRSARILLATAVVGLAGVAVAPAPSASHPTASHVVRVAPDCRRGYYKNVSGRCVKRPGSSPIGATAKCRDGTYSYSQHAAGTCSHHGGVARWIHHP